MEGIIVSYRRGRHVQRPNQLIVEVSSVDTREKAAGLVGKRAVWTTPAGKRIEGTVAAAHGSRGALRTIMDTGIPGQALGTKITIEANTRSGTPSDSSQ